MKEGLVETIHLSITRFSHFVEAEKESQHGLDIPDDEEVNISIDFCCFSHETGFVHYLTSRVWTVQHM